MDKFIELFYYLVYDPETANYYWHNGGVECCLKWGFYTLVICALLVALFYYFYWASVKTYIHGTMKSWLKVGGCGMLITFIASELIVGYFSQLEGMDAYIGQSDLDILKFCLYNGIIGFAIMYLIFSTCLQLLSKDAKNIPWHFFNVRS